MDKNKNVDFVDLGLIEFEEAWDYQTRLFEHTVNQKIASRKADLQKETSNHLIFCSHPPVFTIGKSGDPDHLLLSQDELKEKNIQYFKINRGGDITFHGPGQIVGYPILDLDNFFTDIHLYLRTLEEAVILTLIDYGIDAGRLEGLTGVWIDPHSDNARKICALGVKSSRWVTMHGFAFNVNVDIEYFKYIIPCGIADKSVTSMSIEAGQPLNIGEVKDRLLKHLTHLFDMTISNG